MIRVNEERLWQSHVEMARIGVTPKGGVCRLALTDEDRQGRDLFVSWCRDAGLEVSVDQMGNIFARREGRRRELTPVVTGSHNDTQPTGGRFDGTYGVLAALEVLRTLQDHDVVTERPVEAVLWTNEEGVRFRPPMIASAVHAGSFSLDYGLSRRDETGRTIGEELERIGYKGERPTGREFSAYFEAHIEQGPILEIRNIPVGVVRGVVAIRAFEIRLRGQEAHAGPTPMNVRRDAVLGAAEIIRKVRDIAIGAGEEARCTVGRLHVAPNASSVVPGEVTLSVDCRHPDARTHHALCQEILQAAEAIARDLDLDFSSEEFWTSPPVTFDAECVESIRRAAEKLDIPTHVMTSGAGHDAVHIAGFAPTAMIFVPCENGLSHNEAENARPDHLAAGCNVLLHAVLDHANRP